MQTDSYLSTKNLSLIAIGLLAGMAAIDVLNVILSVVEMNFPYPIELDSGESMSVWMMLLVLLIFLQIPVYILTVVFFLMWLNRSYKNLVPLGAQHLEFTSGWAVGYWFIPFVNLVKPFQVVREVWNQSDPDADPQLNFLTSTGTPALIGFWWALWISSNITTNLASRLDMTGPASEAAIALALYVVANGLSVAAAIAAIMVVSRITGRQAERFERRGQFYSQMEPPPPPTFA